MIRPANGSLHRLLLVAVMFDACDGHPQSPTPSASRPSGEQRELHPGPPQPPPSPTGPDPFVGSYALTLNIGSTCGVVPATDRIRHYSATVEKYASRVPELDAPPYIVTLGDATFLSGSICTAGGGRFEGIGCHQFFAWKGDDTARLVLANNNDEAHGGHIVEQFASGTWAEIIAEASGPVTISNSVVASIEASGSSDVWYCPTPSGYPFPCPASLSCAATDFQLTFTRK